MMEGTPVLEVSHLKKYFRLDRKRELMAVDDVSFTIREGETFGLVGESGCGKTTCGRTCLAMYDKTSGQVLYRGEDVHGMKGRRLQAFRKQTQLLFQDPYASLDPRMTVSDIVGEGLDVHHLVPDRKARARRIYELLEMVGLNEEHAGRFVHEFSGGQRQRIGIARSLAVEPEFLVLDEPISALDVSIQAQVVNLLKEFQRRMKLTYLFVAHDLAMVKYLSDRVGVMYLGVLVEISPAEDLYDHPLHPYTKALLSAIPIPDPDVEEQRAGKRIRLEGEVPSPINVRPGCRFAGRCPYASKRCLEETPALRDLGGGHLAACFAL